jgi:competence protein ComEA
MVSIKDKISNFYKKNLLLCLLGIFVLGGLTVFIITEKRVDGEFVLEGGAEEKQSDINELTEKKIFVDLSGAVNKPGVYELDHGSRVSDLLILGGGFTSEASASWVSRSLNLSKILEDSTKIYVPFEWEFYFPETYKISKTVNKNYAADEKSGSVSGISGSVDQGSEVDMTDISDGGNSDTSDGSGVGENGKINVNTASSSELDSLPGIGPAYAEKIISNRPYEDITDFESKSGLYKSTVENIKELITF